MKERINERNKVRIKERKREKKERMNERKKVRSKKRKRERNRHEKQG
jgi:hypothetical protein